MTLNDLLEPGTLSRPLLLIGAAVVVSVHVLACALLLCRLLGIEPKEKP